MLVLVVCRLEDWKAVRVQLGARVANPRRGEGEGQGYAGCRAGEGADGWCSGQTWRLCVNNHSVYACMDVDAGGWCYGQTWRLRVNHHSLHACMEVDAGGSCTCEHTQPLSSQPMSTQPRSH